MKVKELIDALQEFDGDLEVIAGSDDEGNDYISVYPPHLSWCIEDEDMTAGFYPVHPDDIGVYYDEDELVQKVVL